MNARFGRPAKVEQTLHRTYLTPQELAAMEAAECAPLVEMGSGTSQRGYRAGGDGRFFHPGTIDRLRRRGFLSRQSYSRSRPRFALSPLGFTSLTGLRLLQANLKLIEGAGI